MIQNRVSRIIIVACNFLECILWGNNAEIIAAGRRTMQQKRNNPPKMLRIKTQPVLPSEANQDRTPTTIKNIITLLQNIKNRELIN